MKLRYRLQRLKVHGYGNRRRIGLPQGTFEAEYNPSSLSMSHQNKFSGVQGLNSSSRQSTYIYSPPQELSLTFVLDGTGAGRRTVPRATVTQRVEAFLDLCFHMDGELHQPKFLKIQWGDSILQDFDCLLQSVEVKYTLFDRDGSPLRAELAAVFTADMDDRKRQRGERKSSPDLSHKRIVRAGDTLPALCREIYGSPQHYLRVAAFNNLDHFRHLEPGTVLLFPPLET